MNILIGNDDGYFAEGIKVLAEVTAEFANVRVVAPDRDRTAASNSLTLDRPLQMSLAQNGFYFVNGTPTDCVHLALHALDDFKPDLFFSGINHGANMGDDTLYSGTVAAATEAHLLGIPSVAFSLCDKSNEYWETARHVVWKFAQFLTQNPPKSNILWNVNIPRVRVEDLQGIKVTRLGRRHHVQSMTAVHHPRGQEMFWIGPPGKAMEGDDGTDFSASESGFVTITPLSIDLTHYAQLPAMDGALEGLWNE